MSRIFDEEAVARLMECMKTNQIIEDAQKRSGIARRKLEAAADADHEGDLEEYIGEVVAAIDAETRIFARSFQNRTWIRMMREKIEAESIMREMK